MFKTYKTARGFCLWAVFLWGANQGVVGVFTGNKTYSDSQNNVLKLIVLEHIFDNRYNSQFNTA